MQHIHSPIHTHTFSGRLKARRALNEICAEAVWQQITRGEANPTHLRNRRRYLVKQILKRIPHASRLSPKKLLHAAVMVLSMWGFAGLSMPIQAEAAGNPVAIVNLPFLNHAHPAFADIDGDGDFDLFVGGSRKVFFYRNTGTATAPNFVADAVGNPLASVDTVLTAGMGGNPDPDFVDIDGDGDLDVFLGNDFGTVLFYRNTGTATAPNFVADVANNPLPGDYGQKSKVTFTDIDGDGDFDAFIGEQFSRVYFVRNTGSATAPNFVLDLAGNPLGLSNIGSAVQSFPDPVFGDIDNDGDFDAFIGGKALIPNPTPPNFLLRWEIRLYTNSATGFSTGSTLGGTEGIQLPSPDLVDIDNDGDLDLFVGDANGKVAQFLNCSVEDTGMASAPRFVANAQCVSVPLPDSASQFDSSGTDGDPVNTFTGELFNVFDSDINLGGPMPLFFSRYYASSLASSNITGSMGDNWRHDFEWSLSNTGTAISIVSNRGRVIEFTLNGAVWNLTGKTDVVYRLKDNAGVFTLFDPHDQRLYSFDTTGKLIRIEDGKGNVHTLTYNVAGELTQVSDGLGRVLTMTYTAGKLTGITDGTRTVAFAYTGNDLTSVTDVLSNVTTYSYVLGSLMTSSVLPAGNTPFTQVYTGGKVSAQTNASGNISGFAYGASDTTLTDPLGNTRVHTHTATGELAASQDQAGQSVANGSDATGRRNSITDRIGNVTTMNFHAPSGKPALKINADGTSSSFSYIARASSGVTQYDLAGITNADGTTESFVYDASGDPTSRIDRAGNSTTATYDGHGQMLTMTNTAGGVTSYTYNADATVASATDPAGNITTFGYDALKRSNLTTKADGSTVAFTYDNANRLLTVTDGNANTSSMTYDANGNLSMVTDWLGNSASFIYDGNDRLLSITDSLGGVASVTYDALGRLKTRTDENGNTTTSSYDTLGHLTDVAHAQGNSNTLTYDAEGMISSASDGLGNATAITTDKMGRVTQTRSPLGNISQIGYDSMGRINLTTDPLSQVTTFNHDSNGLLSGITLPGGAVSTTYTRNKLSRITQITDANGRNWQSSFNNQGLLTSRTDPLGNVQTVGYDNRNRPTTINYADGTVQTPGYDPVGNLTSSTYSDGTQFNFTYDANNRLMSADGIALAYDATNMITGSNGITLARDAGGRIISMMLAAGKSVTYAYDANDNLISVTDWAGGVTTFSYDAAGRLIGMSRPNGVNNTNTWDNDSRLIGLTEGAISTISLTRDANGQITTATRTVPLAGTASGVAGNAHTFDAASQIATAGFLYDTRGRLTDDGSRTYTWDADSRLGSITEGATTTTYTYDAGGLRTSRTAGGATRKYVWNYALAMTSISIERDGFGMDQRYFIHTPSGTLLYSIDAASNARTFYHFDEMGDTLFVTDDTGIVTGSYTYTPYGGLTASTGALDNPFTWQGMYGVMNEGNSLYYMRARYYDSVTGRFISRDPIKSINPKGINPYQYATGNPVKFFDPLGLLDGDVNSIKFGGANWQGKYERGFDSLKEVAKDYALDQATKNVPGWDFIPDPDDKDKPDVVILKLTKAILSEALGKSGSEAVQGAKLVELGAKIGLVLYNENTKVKEYQGKLGVWSFMRGRELDAKREAKDALLGGLYGDRDITSLSTMNPLARDILRGIALKRLLKVQSELESKRKMLEITKFKDYWATEIKRLEEQNWFLLNAYAGELAPGEDGYAGVWAVKPSSNQESVRKYGK